MQGRFRSPSHKKTSAAKVFCAAVAGLVASACEPAYVDDDDDGAMRSHLAELGSRIGSLLADREEPPEGPPPEPTAPPPSSLVTPTPANPVSTRVTELARRVSRLQREWGTEDMFTFQVSPPAELFTDAGRTRVRDLEDAVLGVVDAVMKETANDEIRLRTFREAFVAGGAMWAPDSDEWRDGAVSMSIEAAPGHRYRWVVTACLLLAPGSDCLVAVYERRAGAMRAALVARAKDLRSMTDIHHQLTWSISPADASDHYYLLVAYTFPWMASCWRSFQYEVLIPTTDPGRPAARARGSDDAYWCNGFRPKAASNGFTVSFDSWGVGAGPPLGRIHRWRRSGSRFWRESVGVLTGSDR